MRWSASDCFLRSNMSNRYYFITTKTAEAIINLMSFVPYFGFKLESRGDIPDEPVVLAINHKLKIFVNPFLSDKNKRTRWIDHFFIGADNNRKIHFMVQDSRYMKPFTKYCLDLVETFPAHNLKRGLEFSLKGETVAVFPEGQAHLIKGGIFHKGVAWLSAYSKKKIVPVYISKNSATVNNILHPHLTKICIDYLEPIEPPQTTKKEDLEEKICELKRIFLSKREFLAASGQY